MLKDVLIGCTLTCHRKGPIVIVGVLLLLGEGLQQDGHEDGRGLFCQFQKHLGVVGDRGGD